MAGLRRILLCALLLTGAAAAASRTAPPCRCVRFTTDCSSRQMSSVQANAVCPRATKIDLSNNDFREIPSGIGVNVTEIDLSRNRINGSTDALRGMSKLKVLNLKVNALASLAFLPENCVLRSLDVSVNDIVGVGSSLQRCSKLETLDLSFNKIVSLNESGFSPLSRLRSLDLSGNSLGTVPEDAFNGLSQLDSLSLGACQLTALPAGAFRGLRALRRLRLDGNRLTVLERGTLAPLAQLQLLALRGNALRRLPAGLLAPLARLEHLHLERNALQQLPDDELRGLRSLKSIVAQSNELTLLPVLSDCCAELRFADFSDNAIARPSEAAVRALLGGGAIQADLRGNPVMPGALRWVLAASDLRMRTDADNCRCARISRPEVQGYVHVCEVDAGNVAASYSFCSNNSTAGQP